MASRAIENVPEESTPRNLDLFYSFTLYTETFGCHSRCPQGNCDLCIRMKKNLDIFESQKMNSIVMVPTGLFRKYMTYGTYPVTYATTLTFYEAMHKQIIKLFNPKNQIPYANDTTWGYDMRVEREIAWALWQSGLAGFHMRIYIVGKEKDSRLHVIRALEMRVGYGLCIMAAINSIKKNDISFVDYDKYAKIAHGLWSKWCRDHLSTAVAPWIDVCPMDGFLQVIHHNHSFNVRHQTAQRQIQEELQYATDKIRKRVNLVVRTVPSGVEGKRSIRLGDSVQQKTGEVRLFSGITVERLAT